MQPILFDANRKAMRGFALSRNLRVRLGAFVSPMFSQMRDINSEGRDASGMFPTPVIGLLKDKELD